MVAGLTDIKEFWVKLDVGDIAIGESKLGRERSFTPANAAENLALTLGCPSNVLIGDGGAFGDM